jgi:hypothetical protein
MAEALGIKRVGYFDCAGGGQVVVKDGFAYIGHMKSPHGTTIVDVRDPKLPKAVANLGMELGTHSHKVRVENGLMLVNHEVNQNEPGASADFRGGIAIYDVENPHTPKLIKKWETAGQGVHRYDFDGQYVYCSPTVEGYVGNIVMILDLAQPDKPEEIGRWWMPGQWAAGGETPTWQGAAHRCHHPLRYKNRLYTSYWHGGFVILDIENLSNPKLLASVDWSPPYPCPTHSAVPVPFEINGRKFLLVADEDVARLSPSPPAFLWIVDITEETKPIPISTFQIEALAGTTQPPQTGCHQPIEKITGTEVPVAWFANGLRVVDIAKPHTPREVAYYVPDLPPGSKRVSSNDVFVDGRGLIYLIDRVRGLEILERI